MGMLLGLAGPAKSGKDTAAGALAMDLGFDCYAFATPVKLAAQMMFGLTDEETWSDEKKDEINTFWGITHREMFQKVGTEGGRDLFDPDLWIKRATKELWNRYGESDNYDLVVSDVRFDNEADWIHSHGGFVVRINRPDVEPIATSGHASEKSLSPANVDFSVDNDKDINTFIHNFLWEIQELRMNHNPISPL